MRGGGGGNSVEPLRKDLEQRELDQRAVGRVEIRPTWCQLVTNRHIGILEVFMQARSVGLRPTRRFVHPRSVGIRTGLQKGLRFVRVGGALFVGHKTALMQFVKCVNCNIGVRLS